MIGPSGTALTATEKTARVARMILGLYMIVQMWEVKHVRGGDAEVLYPCKIRAKYAKRGVFGTDVGIDEQVEHPLSRIVIPSFHSLLDFNLSRNRLSAFEPVQCIMHRKQQYTEKREGVVDENDVLRHLATKANWRMG
jgi:hypothetical protein